MRYALCRTEILQNYLCPAKRISHLHIRLYNMTKIPAMQLNSYQTEMKSYRKNARKKTAITDAWHAFEITKDHDVVMTWVETCNNTCTSTLAKHGKTIKIQTSIQLQTKELIKQ